jgi:hypothetical protein
MHFLVSDAWKNNIAQAQKTAAQWTKQYAQQK